MVMNKSVDPEKRLAAAWLIQQHLMYIITVKEMLHGWPASSIDVSRSGIGRLLSQLQEEDDFLTSEDGRALMERCGRFLESNQSYNWDEIDFEGGIDYPWYIHIATLGLSYFWQKRSNQLAEQSFNKVVSDPNFKDWPFKRRN